MKEEFFIKQFKNRFIGDDGAVINLRKIENGKWKINNKQLVVASDSFFEDIHFKREWFGLDEISYKASLVNISDIIVMNAKPKYALINIGFPKNLSLKDIELLADGFKKAAEEYNYEIIGGDTIKNEKIAISMTFIGESKKPIFRKAKLNEFVAYTGNLGNVKRDLYTLLRGGKISKNSKFVKPKLRDDFFYRASRYITAACDISDGLFKELERISNISKIGFEFFKKFDRTVGCSGEEYEILFTFPKKNLKAIENISKITRTPITVFAKTKRGKYKNICPENHF
ncbi:thiamine-monophosphate kinase [Lebetimonas natsushimae]|uniref:Thiamine-monophosphate kinase n=1 Tax=Lebetimonas natsushimae TaxID=1936991 RepID=A0A292Y959_9BACT|nr:thiamine-phosphate kinase [Lebetimonas natsushimae]GAX87412.1 thiamine-monophosphate kinase [Lebetimonas natsushimae]